MLNWSKGCVAKKGNGFVLVDFDEGTIHLTADAEADLEQYASMWNKLDALTAAIAALRMQGEFDDANELEELWNEIKAGADSILCALKALYQEEQEATTCSSKARRPLEDFPGPMECFNGQNCISCQKHITNLDGTEGYPCMTCKDNDGCKSCLVKGTWLCKHRGGLRRNNMTCNRWTCEQCIDGSCPIALEEEWIRCAGFSTKDFKSEFSCKKCYNRKKGCDNCIFEGTEVCSNYEQNMEKENV